MKTWWQRFFTLNQKVEVELVGAQTPLVLKTLESLGWKLDNECWSPDLLIVTFVRQNSELFLLDETYFDPKLTGVLADINEVTSAMPGVGCKVKPPLTGAS